MWSRKRVVGAIAALLVACLVGVGCGFFYGKQQGVKEGLDIYHETCYNIGGLTMDEAGRVVTCKGLGQIPEEERKKYLTNGP